MSPSLLGDARTLAKEAKAKMVLEVADCSNLPSYLSSWSMQGNLWEEGLKEPSPPWKLGRSASSLQKLT